MIIGKAFRTGAEAGITRKLTGTVKIYENPSIYVYDTPGVMVPFLGKGEQGAQRGLKLALTGQFHFRLSSLERLAWRRSYMSPSGIDETLSGNQGEPV